MGEAARSLLEPGSESPSDLSEFSLNGGPGVKK